MPLHPHTIRIAFGGEERPLRLADFSVSAFEAGLADDLDQVAEPVTGRAADQIPNSQLLDPQVVPAEGRPERQLGSPETERYLAVIRGIAGILDEPLVDTLLTKPDHLAALVRFFARPGYAPTPSYLLAAQSNPTGLHAQVLLAVLEQQTSPAAKKAAVQVEQWISPDPSASSGARALVANSPAPARDAGRDASGTAATR